jgi:hypothetical protein
MSWYRSQDLSTRTRPFRDPAASPTLCGSNAQRLLTKYRHGHQQHAGGVATASSSNELRHQILSYLTQLRSRPILTSDNGLYYHLNAIPLKTLLTCKVIYTDATDILCRLNQNRPHIMTGIIQVMLKCIEKKPFTLAQQLIDALHTGPSVLFCRNSAHHALRDHILKTIFEKRKGSVVCSAGRRNLSAFLAAHIQSYKAGSKLKPKLRTEGTVGDADGWLHGD